MENLDCAGGLECGHWFVCDVEGDGVSLQEAVLDNAGVAPCTSVGQRMATKGGIPPSAAGTVIRLDHLWHKDDAQLQVHVAAAWMGVPFYFMPCNGHPSTPMG